MKDTAETTDFGVAGKAYLVVRDNQTWRDSHQLNPAQVTTIGRAATNRIVLLDESCSRNHCEVFSTGGQWILRDLGSRNGTLVNEQPVQGDCVLAEGHRIRIGETELAFTHDLSGAFSSRVNVASDTAAGVDRAAGVPIVERRDQPKDLLDVGSDPKIDARNAGVDLAQLYRLAMSMGHARSIRELCQLVLEALHERTEMEIGAILQTRRSDRVPSSPDDLELIAHRTSGGDYVMVSRGLSRLVLTDREAVLAQDVESDSALATSDSLESLSIRSVICAPIRLKDEAIGLIHLYTNREGREFNKNDLEFTLAVADQLGIAIDNLRKTEDLQEGLQNARNTMDSLRQQLGQDSQLVGDSVSMQELRSQIATVAPTDATVLIRGESGVGKELVARAIHFNSRRQDNPFVCMNCAALSESLLESELFGHEKGAFTGATDRKTGKFEQANRGTLFLDEVGEMGPSLQAKFLRVLEGHAFERVGGHQQIKVNVRVVAATNRALEEAVKDGTFRKDLYFRLQVVEIQVPPLRKHRSDIPQLAKYFLERVQASIGRRFDGFTDEALEKLMNYNWPGNIRELQNTVERTAILGQGPWIGREDIRLSTLSEPESNAPTASEPQTTGSPTGWTERTLSELEQEHILATLEMTSWNKSKASQILGIERSTLDRKLKRYRVSRPSRSSADHGS